MKILFLANRVPYPPYRGDKLKIFNLAKRLNSAHELHLLTFAQNKQDLQYKAELEKIFAKVHFLYLPKWVSAIKCIGGLWSRKPFQVLYFGSRKMRKKLDEILANHKFDAIHVQHLRMAQYLAQRKDIPRILDLPDAFSLYWYRRSGIKQNIFRKVFESLEQARLLRYEKIIKDYDLTLVCSQEDLKYLEEIHRAKNLRLLPNGVDMNEFYPRAHDYTQNNTILFTGNMDYAPNVDAVTYFVKDILPIVQKDFNNVKFVIAGQRPVSKVATLANDKIIVTGFVKNLADMYNRASVVVAPLRFGAGTQNKVLEAMAMGIPVVSSNIGFNGMGIQNGEGTIMQTDANEFAKAVSELLRSEAKRTEIGQKGINVIKQKFDWDIITKQLEDYFIQVTAKANHPN